MVAGERQHAEALREEVGRLLATLGLQLTGRYEIVDSCPRYGPGRPAADSG